MKNIELTEDHKVKLLKMCKELFPEYVDFKCFYTDINFFKGKQHFRIHWFEFCVLDLATKLYNLNKRDKICKIELYRGDLIQNYHPIEYLYKEYQYYLKTK